MPVIASLVLGMSRILASSEFRVLMISGGVPAGAEIAYQLLATSMPSRPSSLNVFTSGRAAIFEGPDDRQRAQPPGLNVLNRRRRIEDEIDLPAEQIVDGRRNPAIRHMRRLGAGQESENFRRQMRRCANPAGAIVVLARLRLHLRDEVLQVRGGDLRRIHDQDLVGLGRHDDRREALFGIERHRLVDVRIERERRRNAHQQGVSVRRRTRHKAGCEIAARAGTRLDDHILSERLAQRRSEQARDRIDRAAGGHGRHQRDDTIRIGLRERRRRRQHGNECDERQQQPAASRQPTRDYRQLRIHEGPPINPERCWSSDRTQLRCQFRPLPCRRAKL